MNDCPVAANQVCILSYAEDDELQVVDETAYSSISPVLFWQGVRLPSLPEDFRFNLSKGKRSHVLAGAHSGAIVSEDFLNVLKPFLEDTCQIVPAPTFFRSSNIKVPGYFILNPLRNIRSRYSFDGSSGWDRRSPRARKATKGPSRFSHEELFAPVFFADRQSCSVALDTPRLRLDFGRPGCQTIVSKTKHTMAQNTRRLTQHCSGCRAVRRIMGR